MMHVKWIATALVLFSAVAPGTTRPQTPGSNAAQGPLPVETRVDNFIARQMEARHIPGLALGVVKNGALVYAKGYGDATLEWKMPATPDTVFLLASMTKQFTATAVMMLATEGKLKLDDPITAWVANPPASWSGITVRHLLTHTAGLKDRFELTADGRMYLDYTTPQMLDAAIHTPSDFAPGTKFQYSDQGYFLLGYIIEKASGDSYAKFLRDRIFGPAGMTSTSLHNWNLIVPNRADEYALLGQTIVGSRRRYQFSLVSHFGVPDDGVSAIVLTNLEQRSGSDPCFIARGVDAQYLTAVAIVAVPAKADRDTVRSARLRAVIESFAKGTIQPSDFTAEAFPVINAAMATQKAALEQLGPIQSFQLISDDTLVSQVVRYRVRYQQATLHYRFVLDKTGKIAALSAR